MKRENENKRPGSPGKFLHNDKGEAAAPQKPD